MSSWSRRKCERPVWKKLTAATMKAKICPICLLDTKESELAVLTRCFLAYCVDFITAWSSHSRKINCPLCRVPMYSGYLDFDFRARTAWKQNLPPGSVTNGHDRVQVDHLNKIIGRRRPSVEEEEDYFPVRRRYFGYERTDSASVIAGRVFRWRASIYRVGLQAVLSTVLQREDENFLVRNGKEKDCLLKKIEPWVRRELQAILMDDLDPTIIVHLATSLFCSIAAAAPRPTCGCRG